MPLQTKPEDEPGIVRFDFVEQPGQLQVRCTAMPQDGPPYQLLGGAPLFHGVDAFKAAVIAVGMSPAVAEDRSRTFNATARQLARLGFSVQVAEKKS